MRVKFPLFALLSEEMAPKRNIFSKRGKSRAAPGEGKPAEDGLGIRSTLQ